MVILEHLQNSKTYISEFAPVVWLHHTERLFVVDRGQVDLLASVMQFRRDIDDSAMLSTFQSRKQKFGQEKVT